MQKTHVSRAVRALLDVGVIFEGPKVGRSKTYRLNEQFGWKGTVSNHKRALKNGLSVIQEAELNLDTPGRINSLKRLRGDSRPFLCVIPVQGRMPLGGPTTKNGPSQF